MPPVPNRWLVTFALISLLASSGCDGGSSGTPGCDGGAGCGADVSGGGADGTGSPDTGGTPGACLTEIPCVDESDCGPGLRCNQALVPPACQRPYCGAEGSACDETPLCGSGLACRGAVCTPCTPECGDRVCGDDGCGGSCGTCDLGDVCREGRCGGPDDVCAGVGLEIRPEDWAAGADDVCDTARFWDPDCMNEPDGAFEFTCGKLSCDFTDNVCEAMQPCGAVRCLAVGGTGRATARACPNDPDCFGTAAEPAVACEQDGMCDTWCPNDAAGRSIDADCAGAGGEYCPGGPRYDQCL